MVVGNLPRLMEIFMLELIRTIKKADMEDMYGQTDVFTRETFLKMLSNLIYNFRHGKGRLIYTDGK